MHPGIAIAGGVAQCEARRRVVFLQRFAELQEAWKIRRNFVEPSLLDRGNALVEITADRSHRNPEPLVTLLAGYLSSGGPTAIFFAEIVGDVAHLDDFGGEKLRQ